MELVAEGNTVAGRFRCSGTHLGEFLGNPPTGKRMEVEEVFFLRAEGGKFVDFWGLENSMGGWGSSDSSRHRSVEGQGPCELRRTPLLETVWKVFGESTGW